MKILTVAFFGHRHIENPRHIERLIEQYVQNLIDENEYVDFIEMEILICVFHQQYRECGKGTAATTVPLYWFCNTQPQSI